MYIVRYGGNWDNPKIAFVTPYENVAKAIVLQKKRAKFEELKRQEESFLESRRAKNQLNKMVLADQASKLVLSANEIKYMEEVVKLEDESIAFYDSKGPRTFEDFTYHDWFYEWADEFTSETGAKDCAAVKDNK